MVFSWEVSSVSKRGFTFHHCCGQHGKVFLTWRKNCSSGHAGFKTCLSVQGHRRQDCQGERKTWGTKMLPFAWVSSLFPSSVERWVSISPSYKSLELLQNPEQLFISTWPGCSRLLFHLYPGSDEIFFLLFYKTKTNRCTYCWEWNTKSSGWVFTSTEHSHSNILRHRRLMKPTVHVLWQRICLPRRFP